MKRFLRKCCLSSALAMLMILMLSLPAFADAIDYDATDWTNENYDCVVSAQDGSGYLYLRSGPGMSYSILCNIVDGVVLHIDESCTDRQDGVRWGHTYYNGKYGWVSLKHTTINGGGSGSTPSGTTAVDYDVVVSAQDGSGYLYLRSGPNMDYQIYCNIYDGEQLHINAECADSSGQFVWGRTVYNGTEGWVSLKHTVSKSAWDKAHPTQAPTEKPTPTPELEEEEEEEEVATPTPTAKPTVEPTKEATPTPTAAPTATPTATPAPASSSGFNLMLIVVVAAAIVLVVGAVAALIITRERKR